MGDFDHQHRTAGCSRREQQSVIPILDEPSATQAKEGIVNILQRPDFEGAKRKNIIEMALDFTGMMRIFSKRSKAKIRMKLEELFSQLTDIRTGNDYQALHQSFCEWFILQIPNAEKRLKNGKVQPSRPSSYGQAAKVLDIAIKVYVYYCALPSLEIAQRIVPFLNGAVDTPILNHLKTVRCAIGSIRATTIQGIDQSTYLELQSLLLAKSGDHHMHPVQYDDVLWRQLNREDSRDIPD
jgi:hypothetical protein